MGYGIKRIGNGVRVHNPSPNYTLIVEFDKDKVQIKNIDIRFSLDIGGPEQMVVYERGLSDYLLNFGYFRMDPNFQYLEVGAGLGGFIPFLVNESSQRPVSKPIVIDPANYLLMSQMLEYAKGLDLDAEINEYLDKLMGRAQTILDPQKVHLVNMKLGEALESKPELRGVADVVIDLYGPANYPWTEISGQQGIDNEGLAKRVIEMEKELLKPNGLHLVKSDL